ncbi:MAG: MFS transporter, partial [Deltaproteobacteria bacterium]
MPDAPVPRLGRFQKISYGAGQVAEGIKNNSFEFFLFFYYNQVLGLSGTLGGAAVAIALVTDAITDPLAGSLSDSTRSRWGRRHPFMYAAPLPLALCFYLVFNPPAGLGELGLFAWLCAFAVLTRSAMTLYHVPHMALGAELSEDYLERTVIVAYRVFFGLIGVLIASVGGLLLFLP